jgi:hypothetical protein
MTYAFLFWALLHAGSVLAFQYTGIYWFLLIPVLHICLNMVLYVIAVAACLDPNFPQNDKEKRADYGPRFLVQLGMIITAGQLYLIGYAFFAGMVVLQSITLGTSVILQKISSKG